MAEGFKERYDEHMAGRNGGDALSRICLIAAIVLIILSFFVVGVSPFLYVLTLVLGIAAAVYAFFRMNSTDVAARQDEVDRIFGGKGGRSARPSERSRATRSERRARRTREEEPVEDDWQDEVEEPGEAVEEEPAQPSKIMVSCDECGQKLSVPTGRGTIRVTCPRCSNKFTMTS